MQAERQYMSTKEAAEIAGVSIRTIYTWIDEGRLKSSQPGSRGKKHGGPHRIKASDLRALLDGDKAFEARS